MIKVICLDLDGTLLNSESKINKEDRTAIKRCIKNGIKVTVCTGKTYSFVSLIVEELGLTGLQVASNGATVINEFKEHVWTNKISDDIYISLIKILREENRSTVAHHLDGNIYCENHNAYLEEISNTGEILTRVDDLLSGVISSGILMLTYEGDEDDRLHIRLVDIFSEKLRIRKGAPARMDVYSVDAGKANAMDKVLGFYGVRRKEVMAIGDSENDLGLMKLAGASVAMGNSPGIVKTEADFVVSDNDNNGVAEALNRIIFND